MCRNDREVKGRGEQKGITPQRSFEVDRLPKVNIEIVVIVVSERRKDICGEYLW